MVLLLYLRLSAPGKAIYLKNAIISASILQDILGCGVVVTLIVCHADP